MITYLHSPFNLFIGGQVAGLTVVDADTETRGEMFDHRTGHVSSHALRECVEDTAVTFVILDALLQ